MGGILGRFLVLISIAMALFLGLFIAIDAIFLKGGDFTFKSLFVFWIAIGAMILIGGILWITGNAKGKEKQELAAKIFKEGILTRGKVTFVDKNYNLLVNEKPIYSIVEVVFNDEMGREHVSRKDNIESDLVIRSQVVIGSEIDLKYMRDDPTKNAFIIWDPGTRPENWDGSMPM